MKRKIIADSAANLMTLADVDFTAVPLRIRAGDKEYVDTQDLDVNRMVQELSTYHGKSSTACPGVGDWIEAFEDAEEVFCVTIISVLSGSYNSACAAKKQYEEDHPGRRVYVLDSFSAGAEEKMLVWKLRELVMAGLDFDTICEKMDAYKAQHTSLVFCLKSLTNLANNGRVSHAIAALCNVLGIRVVGDVNEEGLHPTDKSRGEKRANSAIVRNMKHLGYCGGPVCIDHCFGEEAAQLLKDTILTEYPDAQVLIEPTLGLCSFYAERGGLMIGFEVN